MALSVTICPAERHTRAVLYGCSDNNRALITKRLSRAVSSIYHPLAIPLLFCDIERKRHFDLINPIITKLVARARGISKPPVSAPIRSWKSVRSESSSSGQSGRFMVENPEDLMTLWLEVNDLRRGMETWRQQLQKMMVHCEELMRPTSRRYLLVTTHDADSRAGHRIMARLGELEGEYDEKIRQCTNIIDGMVLAAQLVRFLLQQAPFLFQRLTECFQRSGTTLATRTLR